jgi:hypothetical protein
MILKASSRGGAKQLAQHLMSDENDHVTVHSIEGTMSDSVEGAFREMYAISKGTKCRKFMFSLSLNPPPNEVVKIEGFEDAIKQVESKLNLTGQPKAVVFHEKAARRHCHCVWSRIDTDNMKAIEMGLYKKQLNEVAKDLYIQHGWQMPKGFLGRAYNDPRNFTLKEWKQAERNGLNPRQIKATLQRCWTYSDNKKSFTSALKQNGFFLAQGDKKNVHLAVDWNGEVYPLRRSLGIKVKELKQRLGEADKFPTINATKAIIKQAQSEAHTKLTEELALRHKYEVKPLRKKKAKLVKEQRIARAEQHNQHTKRQQQEREERQKHYRRGFKGLWDLVTGRHRELKRTHEVRQLAANNRDWEEKEALIKTQLETSKALQIQLDIANARQQKAVMALNADFVANLHSEDLSNNIKSDFNVKPQKLSLKPNIDRSPELSI